jgi:hypothetical protein
MYDVFWAPSALDDLAAVWVDADANLREAVTLASAEIDALLAHSPLDVGESRDGEQRITFVSPFGVIFEVRSAVRRVVVTHVWFV